MSGVVAGVDVALERLDVPVYTVATDCPESDGTATWEATTIVLVEAHGGARTGSAGHTAIRPARR